ncbi:MAG: flagellar protein FlgN [Senegalia sp. (in: firmicutes)]|uniref:flagellar protein FlgN n=1 Tax=Senegalia sp. (in: firmicutes) TaxID=1924098 RepID=UPI003F9B22F7
MIKKIVRLIELLDDKKILLDDFYKLSIVQKKLIENDDIDKLNRIIKNKEELISKINLLDKDFLEIYNELKEENNIRSLSELDIDKVYLARLKEITNRCDSLMQDIKVQDESNNSMMENNFEDVKTKLREIKRGKTTTNKYYNKSQNTDGYFIDSKK